MVNVGIALGPLLGGLALNAGFALTAPLWIGVAMATLGVLTLLPYLRRPQSTTPKPPTRTAEIPDSPQPHVCATP